MNSVVLDASALMAFLRSEPGSGIVQSALADAVISTVNLSEVLAKAAELSSNLDAVKTALQGLQLRVVPFDERQAEIAAGLRPVTRPLGLSLGDRCCLALGMAEGVSVLTADRDWAKLQLDIEIKVIR
jgi:PIN domain nuclease of toxin-antitoxin system